MPRPSPSQAHTDAAAVASAPAAIAKVGKVSGRHTHLVTSGETLWSIAAADLGSGASAAEISAEVRRIWHLNAGRIGSGDPNVIFPGQRLRV